MQRKTKKYEKIRARTRNKDKVKERAIFNERLSQRT